MKKIAILCCMMLAGLPSAMAQKPSKNNKTPTRHFVIPSGTYYIFDFFRSDTIQARKCFIFPEFQKIIDDATSDDDMVTLEQPQYLSFFQIDTPSFDYQDNEKDVMEKIMQDNIIDLATKSGRIEALKRLSYVMYLVKKQAPLQPGTLKSDLDTGDMFPQVHCLGRFKTIPDENGFSIILFPIIYCLPNYKGEYEWLLWAREQTGSVCTKYQWYLGYQ